MADAAMARDYHILTQAQYENISQIDLRPGDRVLLASGRTFQGRMHLDANDSGADADGKLVAPVTITSDGAERATIDAQDGAGIYIHNAGGITISNLRIIGSGEQSNTDNGITFYNDTNTRLQHIRLTHLEVTGFGGQFDTQSGWLLEGWGIYVTGDTHGFEDVLIENCQVHHNRNGGMRTWGRGWKRGKPAKPIHSNVTVRNCISHNNSGIAGAKGHSGNGIILSSVNGGLIEHCVAHHNGANNTSDGGPVGLWASDSHNITIQFNESHHNKTQGGDGGGFDLDQNVTGSRMQYNYSHDNDGAGYLIYSGDDAHWVDGNVVRYNISQNDGRNGKSYAASGIFIGNKVRNLNVYGNTIFMSKSSDVDGVAAIRITAFGSKPSDIVFANNILISTSNANLVFKEADAGEKITFAGNAYWPSGDAFGVKWNGTMYQSLEQWRAATQQETVDGQATGFAVDPKLVGAGTGETLKSISDLNTLRQYMLRADSPLIDRGLDLEKLFQIDVGEHDFFGTPIPRGKALDVGAGEFASDAE